MQFKSVYTKENLENIPNKGRSPYPNMPNIQVTEQGVHKLLKHIKPHKATGPDKIQGRFLKEMALEITPAITYLFNKSLELGRVPKDWLDAHSVPVFKKGEKIDDQITGQFHSPVSSVKFWNILCNQES